MSRSVNRLQALLHAGELRIAKSLLEAAALVAGLQHFGATISKAGYATLGAPAGKHDDPAGAGYRVLMIGRAERGQPDASGAAGALAAATIEDLICQPPSPLPVLFPMAL